VNSYLFKKNTILVWNRHRIIVSMLGRRGVPSLQSFSNAKEAFVDDTRIIKIYAMVERPRMFCIVWPLAHVLTFLIHLLSYEFQNTGQFRLHNTNHNWHRVFYKSRSVDVQYSTYVISNILKRKFSKPPTVTPTQPKNWLACFLKGLRLKRILTVLLSFPSSMVSRNH